MGFVHRRGRRAVSLPHRDSGEIGSGGIPHGGAVAVQKRPKVERTFDFTLRQMGSTGLFGV